MREETWKLLRAWLMYLADCEETDSTPNVFQFGRYLTTVMDLNKELFNERARVWEVTFG